MSRNTSRSSKLTQTPRRLTMRRGYLFDASPNAGRTHAKALGEGTAEVGQSGKADRLGYRRDRDLLIDEDLARLFEPQGHKKLVKGLTGGLLEQKPKMRSTQPQRGSDAGVR